MQDALCAGGRAGGRQLPCRYPVHETGQHRESRGVSTDFSLGIFSWVPTVWLNYILFLVMGPVEDQYMCEFLYRT